MPLLLLFPVLRTEKDKVCNAVQSKNGKALICPDDAEIHRLKQG